MTTSFRIIVFLIVATSALSPAPIKALNPRKLDDTTPDDQLKCGGCPCDNPCYSSPPPPSPSPPPPSPSPPPPPKKKPPPPSGVNCPPPPSGGGGGGGGGDGEHAPPDYIYITGPPGNIYPIAQTISAARRSFTVAPVVVGGLLGMMAFW